MTLLCEDLSELYSHFNEYRLEEKCCDVIIKVGERCFPCHRIILASIEYFRGMFSGKFVEAERKEIELKGINENDFELLLTHIYGSSVKIKDDNVYRLLRISHYMGPPSLENLCIDHIIKSSSIPLNTVLCIFIFAFETKKTILIEELIEFMAQNFVSVSKHAKFFKIPAKELLQILTHPKLDKDSAAVLDFLNIWARSVGEGARKLLPDLLAAVSLSEVPMEWFMKTLLRNSEEGDAKTDDIEEPFVKRTRKDADEAPLTEDQESIGEEHYSFFMNTTEDFDLSLTQSMPFSIFSLDTRSAENGDASGNVSSVINMYKLMINKNGIHQVQHSNTEIEVPKGYRRVHCKSVFIDGLRFMVVCVDKGPVVTTAYVTPQVYDYTYNRHKIFEKREPQVHNFDLFLAHDLEKSLETHTVTGDDNLENMAAVANDTNIYLYNGTEFVMYITQRNKWVPVPTTGCVKTLSPNLLSREKNLYLIGGKSATAAYAEDEIPMMHAQTDGKLFQRFDLREGRWSQLPKITYARYKSASCLFDDMLYVSGGDDLAYYKGYIERFDFKAGKWDIFETSLPEPKMRHTLIGHENQLWFFGGENYHSKKVVNDLSWYAYDLKKHSWSNFSHMPSSYRKFTTKEILDVINVI